MGIPAPAHRGRPLITAKTGRLPIGVARSITSTILLAPPLVTSDDEALLRGRGILKGGSKYYISLAHPDEDIAFTIDGWKSAIQELKA